MFKPSEKYVESRGIRWIAISWIAAWILLAIALYATEAGSFTFILLMVHSMISFTATIGISIFKFVDDDMAYNKWIWKW